MSVKNVSWVFDHSPYKLGARLVHLALADTANDEYRSLLWDGQATIAKKAGVSRATVNTVMKTMLADGYLEAATEEERSAIRGLMRDTRATVYRFVRMCKKSDTSDQGVPVNPGDAMCKNDDARCVKTAQPRLLVTQEQPKVTQEHATPDPLIGFDKFWSAYPERRGKKVGKALTRERWAKLSLEEKRAAYRGAVNLFAAVAADVTLPKDPERYLRGRVWEDWQEPATPAPRRDPLSRGGPSVNDQYREMFEAEAALKEEQER